MNSQEKSLSKFICYDCLFYRQGMVPDRRTPPVLGRAREYVDGTVCALRPPVAGAGRPIVESRQVCALWTDENGDQPLRHLIESEGVHHA